MLKSIKNLLFILAFGLVFSFGAMAQTPNDEKKRPPKNEKKNPPKIVPKKKKNNPKNDKGRPKRPPEEFAGVILFVRED